MAIIEDGADGHKLRITSDRRALVDGTMEKVSAERSRAKKLFGLGTGNLTITDSFSLGSVLWFRNDSTDEEIHVQKIIFGWNGGSTTWIKTVFSLIFYNTPEPSANHTSIDDQIENITAAGPNPVKSDMITAYKWDGVGTGMTVAAGGFAQIPNRLGQGDKTKDIDGEIILGPGKVMEFRMTPEETGEFHVSVVYFFAPTGGRSEV